MKKPFSFDKRSKTVFCINPKCAQIRGAEGVSRMPIKMNVLARQTTEKPLMCYDCNTYFRTGRNRHQRKALVASRKLKRAAEASLFKTMDANA